MHDSEFSLEAHFNKELRTFSGEDPVSPTFIKAEMNGDGKTIPFVFNKIR